MNISKKEIILIGFVVVMAGLYGYFFTDWFRAKYIRIEHTARPLREAWGPNGRVDPTGKQVNNVTFSLHKDYQLTSVQVVLLEECKTNPYPHALWSLSSKSGSAPVNAIAYGMPIEGMESSVASAGVEPLEAGVEYRLLVEARSVKGTNDFNIPARSASR